MKISLSTVEKDGDKKITFNLVNGDVMDDNKFYLFIDNETYTYNNKKISTSYQADTCLIFDLLNIHFQSSHHIV